MIIAYLSREGKELELIRSIASQYWEAFIFGYVIDERVAEAEGLTVPAVVSYKNTDGDNRAISGELNEEKLEMFLELASKNVIGDFNERSMNDYMAVRNSFHSAVTQACG